MFYLLATATVKLIPLAVGGGRIETKMRIEPFEPSLKKAKSTGAQAFDTERLYETDGMKLKIKI